MRRFSKTWRARSVIYVLILTACIYSLFRPALVAGRSRSVSQISADLVPAASWYPLVDLVPQVHWSSWYQQESGYLPHPDHFGAYVTLAHQGDLYIGLGSARPAENSGDGAMLARYNGEHLDMLGVLTEQGVHEMIWDTDRLHIAGTDPCCGDGWEAGNHYVYAPQAEALQKYRDPVEGLVEVVHTWGLWLAADQELFASVSANHNGVRAGEIFKSVDRGANWARLSNLGENRVYDIVGFQGKMYALYNDQLGAPLSLAVSEDSGQTWTDILSDVLHRIHLTEFQGALLAVSHDRQSIYRLQDMGITVYKFPAGVKLGITYPEGENYNYNLLAVGGDTLYTIWESESGGEPLFTIVRSRDLQTWEPLTSTQEPLISLLYWPDQDSLIASSNGEGAKLWQVRLAFPGRAFFPLFTRGPSP